MSNLADAPADEGGSPTEAAVVDDVQGEADVFLKTGASTYKDRKTAEESITKLEAEYRRSQNALAEKDRLLAQLQADKTRDEALSAITEKLRTIAAQPGKSEADIAAEIAAIEAEGDANPGKKMVELYRELAQTTGREAAEIKKQIEALKTEGVSKHSSELAELKAEVAEMKLAADPTYQENREVIDEMATDLKISKQDAIKWLAKVKPEVAQRQIPPGYTGGGRTMPTERSGRRDVSMDADVFQTQGIDPNGPLAKDLRAKWDADFKAGRIS